MSAVGGVLGAARAALRTGESAAKAQATAAVFAEWRAGSWPTPQRGDDGAAPDRPARPDRPELVAPGQVPRRRLSSDAGRVALLHAVAHIEFNAIDLALDMVARFSGDADIADADRYDFVDDWLSVAADEARHFGLIQDRLSAFGATYGDLPAHDGLWSAAMSTAHDLGARLAVAPMVLEARGLDVTPGMIAKLRAAGDEASAGVLQIIYEEEVGHVAAGRRWFERVCASRNEDCVTAFHRHVRTSFAGALKPPFNISARSAAGLSTAYFEPLAAASDSSGAS